MKLLELEKEIHEFKRIRMKCWNDEVYVIKSLIAEQPLIQCDFMSMQMTEFKPTLDELFANDWYVMN